MNSHITAYHCPLLDHARETYRGFTTGAYLVSDHLVYRVIIDEEDGNARNYLFFHPFGKPSDCQFFRVPYDVEWSSVGFISLGDGLLITTENNNQVQALLLDVKKNQHKKLVFPDLFPTFKTSINYQYQFCDQDYFYLSFQAGKSHDEKTELGYVKIAKDGIKPPFAAKFNNPHQRKSLGMPTLLSEKERIIVHEVAGQYKAAYLNEMESDKSMMLTAFEPSTKEVDVAVSQDKTKIVFLRKTSNYVQTHFFVKMGTKWQQADHIAHKFHFDDLIYQWVTNQFCLRTGNRYMVLDIDQKTTKVNTLVDIKFPSSQILGSYGLSICFVTPTHFLAYDPSNQKVGEFNASSQPLKITAGDANPKDIKQIDSQKKLLELSIFKKMIDDFDAIEIDIYDMDASYFTFYRIDKIDPVTKKIEWKFNHETLFLDSHMLSISKRPKLKGFYNCTHRSYLTLKEGAPEDLKLNPKNEPNFLKYYCESVVVTAKDFFKVPASDFNPKDSHTSNINQNTVKLTGKECFGVSTLDDLSLTSPRELADKCGYGFTHMIKPWEESDFKTEPAPYHIPYNDPFEYVQKNKNEQLHQIMANARKRFPDGILKFRFFDDSLKILDAAKTLTLPPNMILEGHPNDLRTGVKANLDKPYFVIKNIVPAPNKTAAASAITASMNMSH